MNEKEATAVRFRRASWMTALVIIGVIAYACITLMNMRTKVANANETQAQLQQQVEKIQEENAALQYAIEHKDDLSTIEDIARDKLGLVMPEEKIFYDSGQ